MTPLQDESEFERTKPLPLTPTTSTNHQECPTRHTNPHARETLSLIPLGARRGTARLTFDLHEHEVLVGRGAVVGHLLGDVDAAQADPAEVLLGGQAGQRRLRVL